MTAPGTTAPARRWPAEWEPHRATWLSWPHNTETWPADVLPAVEDAFCEIVRAISPGEAVEINVLDAAMGERVLARLRGAGVEAIDRVRVHVVPTDDAWVRDHGGIFVFAKQGVSDGSTNPSGATPSLELLDFEFDAWGGKYPPWDRDAKVVQAMARIANVPRIESAYVLEAGSIEGDGQGTILTTESCLLNPNRARPGQDRSREGLEAMLGDMLGAKRVLWLGDGIQGDDTDGHVDDLARFVGPGQVVTIACDDANDADFLSLAENRGRLVEMRDAGGRLLDVVDLPTPGVIAGPEGRLPASYANFYFANAALLVPVFGVEADGEAIEILERIVVDRPVVPIPGRELVMGLGAVHCLTQPEPLLHGA